MTSVALSDVFTMPERTRESTDDKLSGLVSSIEETIAEQGDVDWIDITERIDAVYPGFMDWFEDMLLGFHVDEAKELDTGEGVSVEDLKRELGL